MGLMITRDVTVRAIREALHDSTFTTKTPIKNLLKKKKKKSELVSIKTQTEGCRRLSVSSLPATVFFYLFFLRYCIKCHFGKNQFPPNLNIQLCVITVSLFYCFTAFS